MKQVQACLSGMEDRENSFHHCGGPAMLVEADASLFKCHGR